MRAGLLGAALAVLTLAGHTAAGGALDALGIGIVAVLSTALAAALSTRALSLPVLIAVLLAGQGFLHLVVSLGVSHPHGSTGTSSAGTSSTAMIAGHAVAGIVAALLIAHADRLAARWNAFLASVIGVAVAHTAAIAHPAPAFARDGHDPRATLVLLLHGVVRRGPPASVVLT